MTVAFRAESHTITTSSSNPAPGEPAGTASGDFLVSLGLIASGSGTWTIPTSWTSLTSGTQGAFKWNLCYILRGGSAASTTWTKSAGSFYYEVYILGFNSGASLPLVLDAQSSVGTAGNANNHSPDPPAVVAVASASMAVACGVNWNGSATSWTAPTGYTVRSNNAAGNDGVMITKSLAASGSENPGVITGNAGGTSDYWDGFTITVAESAQNTPELYGAGGLQKARQYQQLLAQRDEVRSGLSGRKWHTTGGGLEVPEPFKIMAA